MARRRGRIRREQPALVSDPLNGAILADRDWDSDEYDAYGLAVSTVLESMEGLWFDTNDPDLEREVNDHIANLKLKIQGML